MKDISVRATEKPLAFTGSRTPSHGRTVANLARGSVRLVRLLLYAFLSIAFAVSADARQETVPVSTGDATEHLIKTVAPIYPPLAKQVRIQGKVKLQVVISKTGTVDSVKVLSGHPLLVQAAIDAVKQWQYKPFLADGQPVAASTEIEVPFSLGISAANYQTEQKNNEDYFKREDECRNLLDRKSVV